MRCLVSDEAPEAVQKLPLWRNIRWFQLVYGVVAGIMGYQLYRHYSGAVPLDDGAIVLRLLGLALLTFVFAIYLQNIYRFGLVPDYSLKCRHCNGPVNRYSEFCEHCGADLIAEEKLIKCPKCSVELYEGTNHCPECGARIAAKKKGKKGGPPEEPPREGWDRPLDATSPPPWEDPR